MPSATASPARIGVAFAIGLLLACSGCEERRPTHAADASVSPNENVPDASTHLSQVGSDPSMPLEQDEDGSREFLDLVGPAVDMPLVTHLLPLAGKVDVANRYLSAVMVFVEFEEKEKAACGGVIIGRRLVLTAGHCVCQGRKLPAGGGAQTLIDGAACAKTASVKTLVYQPGEEPDRPGSSYGAYQQGAVRPHPELRILMDAQGQVESNTADLALILLDEPVDPEFKPVPLADRDVQLHESIVIVGSGYDELARAYDGDRRYSRNKVTEWLPSGGGRMRIEQPGGHHYRGESGGPCLREELGRITLVGISARNLGAGEAITSTYAYRDWLHGEIRRAERMKPPSRPE